MLPGSPADAAVKPPSGLSQDTVTLDLALMYKLKGDELFISSAPTVITRQSYNRAAAELAGADLELSPPEQISLKLLKADIAYRTLLLDRDLSFWGAVRSLRPSSPTIHLQRMKNLLEQYSKVNSNIQEAAARNVDRDLTSAELGAIVAQQVTNLRTEGIASEKIAMQQEFAVEKQDRLDGRVVALRQDRQVLENQLEGAVSEARAASAALNSLITSAAIESIGIPAPVVSAMKDGKWERAVQAVILDQIATNPSVVSALGDIDQSVAEVAETIQTGHRLVQEGQQSLATLQAARETLRHPTIQGLTALGSQVYARLDEGTRRDWTAKVKAAVPAEGLVEMIDAVNDQPLARQLRDATVAYLSGNVRRVDDFLKGAIAVEVQRRIETLPQFDATRYQGELIAKAARLASSASDQRLLLDQAARNWSGELVAQVPASVMPQLLAAARVGSKEELSARLASSGLDALPSTVSVQGGLIQFGNAAGGVIAKTSLLTFTDRLAGTIPSVARDPQTQLVAVMDRMRDKGSEQLRQVVIDALPTDAIQGAVHRLLNDASPQSEAARRQDAWAGISGRLAPAQQGAALEGIVAAHVGSVYVAEDSERRIAQATTEARTYPPVKGQPGLDPRDQMAQAAVMAALNAAFPGASLAAGAVTSFNNFSDAIERAQNLAGQLQRNIVEELQIIDLVGEERLRREVLIADMKISQILQDSAREQQGMFQNALGINADDRVDNERRITARRSLAFYINERMRAEFDALERSISLWTGRGTIESRIRQNPQYIRLELDKDIHLYSWLDRTGESRRADIDGLEAHWQKMYQLALEDCEQLGCSPDGAGDLGKFKQTDLVPLKGLLSAADWNRLLRWQGRRDISTPLQLPMMIAPTAPLQFGVEPDLENLRVVEVRLGWRATSGLIPFSAIRLAHPGLGYVLSQGKLRRDVLLPQENTSFAAPVDINVEQARRRYLGNTAKLNQFEGYSFYSPWTLTLLPGAENWDHGHQAVFRFGLHYTSAVEVPLEADFLQRAKLQTSAAQLLPPEAFRYRASWSNGTQQTVVAQVGGTSRQIHLPSSGRIDIGIEQAAVVYAPAGVGGSAVGAKQKRVALTRSCVPDTDLRHYLRLKIRRDAPVTATGAEIRRKAETELARAKSAECRDIAISTQGAN